MRRRDQEDFMSVLKIASVGTSAIMRVMQEAISLTGGAEAVLVYSRDAKRGKEFADSIGIKRSTDDFDALLKDEEANTVYIASPNVFHPEQAIAALRHKKHVILEKPSALTAADARLIFDTARENGVFCFEAITTVYMPDYIEMKKALKYMGNVSRARISYGQYSSKYDAYLAGKNPNIFNPSLGGGALNDMGIYCVHTAIDLFGEPGSVRYDAKYGPNGADLSGKATLKYKGFECALLTSKNENIESGLLIECENGWAFSSGPLNEFYGCTVCVNGEKRDVCSAPRCNRMIYELREFVRAVRENDKALFELRAKESVAAAEVLEKARTQNAAAGK